MINDSRSVPPRGICRPSTITHGEGPSTIVGSDVIGHTLDMDLRHSVVTHMHKSTFYVTLEVNPAVIHNKGLRDQLIHYYAELKDSVRCLAVYDALNADRDIKKSYVQGLCVCHTEVADKGTLVVFVRSPDMLPPLVTARSWRRNLVVKAFPKLQNQRSNKYFVDSYNSATNSTDSLRIIGQCYKTSWEERDLVGLRTPADIVVQVPRANAKDHLNSLKPGGVVKVVQKALGANPGYDKDWALGATVSAGGNIIIPLTNRQALKALLLDKSWQVDLRRRLALGRQAYRIQLMGAVLNHTDFNTKYGRSRIARTLVNRNYNGKLERRDIQNVDWYSEKLTPQHGSVVVTFARAGAANLALKEGLRWQSTLHECLRLPDDEFVEQCYKCQAYEYNEAGCLGDLHCAYCAMDHCTLDCEETFRKCVLCGGSHASTDPVCPLRATRESEAKQRISLKEPFASREHSRRYSQATVPEKQDATTSLPRDSGLEPVPINPNPTPSRDTRLSIKEGTSLNGFPGSSNDPLHKRTAPGPFGFIDGNGRSTPSAKRVKREGAEQDVGAGEDPIQKYNAENGAIPWPPPRDERTMGVAANVSWENQVQQKKSRNANRKAANRRWKRGEQRS